MKICFIPIDNRPVCYNLAIDIASIDDDIDLMIPPREYLGSLTKIADIDKILNWLEDVPMCDAIILSLDTIAYGGLIPSRRGKESLEEIKERICKLKDILKVKNAKIYAFSSIMRIPNNNYNEEEKEYWSEYGKNIFEYSYNLDKFGKADSSKIPDEILNDYLKARKRNFEINKIYLEWQKEGFFDTLIFSKDDCAEFGLNVKEARELEKSGGFTKTGADEIPLTLMARSIEKDIKVYVQYTEPDCTDLISNYEDVSIEKSVLGQLELGGFKRVNDINESNIVLIVNNFREKQGEIVMGWGVNVKNKNDYSFNSIIQEKPFAVADVRNANGADNDFAEKLLNTFKNKNIYPFLGYAGWNTSANTIGSLLAGVKVAYNAEKYNEQAFKRLQMIRFLDDWAYQANVREQIDEPCDIKAMMKPYIERLSEVFNYKIDYSTVTFTHPWNRKFEIEVDL